MYNKEQAQDAVLDFLKDTSRREFTFQRNGGECMSIVKSEFDQYTDFLYSMYAYREQSPHSIKQNLEYSGIYSRKTGLLYDLHYHLSVSLGLGYGEDISKILDAFSDAVSCRVASIVNGKPVPVTEETETIRDNRAYFEEYGVHEHALRAFYKGMGAVSYDPHVKIENPSTALLMRIIHFPVEACEEQAAAYVRKNANLINLILWEDELTNKQLVKLESMPGDHHLRRKIASCVDTEKMSMVNLEIEKEGKRITAKIEAQTLARANDTYYSEYNMDAPGRRLFESTYGRQGRLYASDILSITYGKKTLYQKES